MPDRKIFETTLANGHKTELFEREGGSPEIFFDGAWGITVQPTGVCKINLFTIAPSLEDDYERREVAARIVMTGQTMISLRDFLTRHIKTLKERGMIEEVEVEVPVDDAEKT